MTYTISIDQEFATENGLTLVQACTLSAFLSLPVWAKSLVIDGAVWYQYSDSKMSEDFPLLFGVPKRCYKNACDLVEMGFLELTKIGQSKYVRFTERCGSWNRTVRNRTNSPKSDSKQSEIGPENSPKSDSNPNIINPNIITIQDNILFPPEDVRKPRKTSETLCLFENSRYADFGLFSGCFDSPDFQGIDIAYYYHAVADWSASKGAKKRDWIATARNFIRADVERGKVKRCEESLPQDAIDYLKSGFNVL